MTWGSWVERLCAASLVLSVLAAFNPESPSYNAAIAFFGLYACWVRNNRALWGFLAILIFSLFCDIAYMGLYHTLDRFDGNVSTGAFGVTMLIGNLVLKVPLSFASFKLFSELGGTWAMTNPHVEASSVADVDTYATLQPGMSGPGTY